MKKECLKCPAPKESEGSDCQILVVDDEASQHLLMQGILEENGYRRTTTASSGEEALKIIEAGPVDLLITDITMPGMDGLSLIAEARRLSDDFIALVVTGADDKDTAIAALNAGAFGYMQKPVTVDDVIYHTRRALEYLEMKRFIAMQEEANMRQTMLAHGGRMAALGEMAAAMAHEINQPLNIMSIVVQGWEILADRGRLKMDKVLADVDKLRGNIERISGLIDHIRCLGRQHRDLTEIYPSEVLCQGLNLCHVQLKKHNIDFLIEVDPDLPPIMGVANELEQVIINLIVNARYAIEERAKHEEDLRGRIEVRAACIDKQIEIIIRDNGGGLPAVAARKAFEPFFSTKPVGVGTGLGLSISREIIEKFGGTLTLRNQPGEGAEFGILIP
ncbi:MAG TPA: response regulator [Desulfobacterales bacterium]|nr:response regulator [Desulfobacterales bacterium]